VKHLKKMCAAGLVSLLALTVGVAPASASWLSMSRANSKARSAARALYLDLDESQDWDMLGCYRVSSATANCKAWFDMGDDVQCTSKLRVHVYPYGTFVSRYGKSHCY
jgi:hypothetical protein